MIGFCPLASGSKGNALYLGTQKTKILIDAGISGKTAVLRLAELGVDIKEIEAIIISHEHQDHIQGLRVLAFRYGIPVVANAACARAICDFFHDTPKFKIFTTNEPFAIGDLTVNSFHVKHDAVEPVGFTFQVDGIKIGVCTDLGCVTKNVLYHLTDCHLLYAEANHEPHMVHASSRPPMLKGRILGPTGHLSNEECGKLISHVYHAGLKQAFLAHLSSECNTPQIALNIVSKVLEERGISLPLTVALQDQKTRPTLFT